MDIYSHILICMVEIRIYVNPHWKRRYPSLTPLLFVSLGVANLRYTKNEFNLCNFLILSENVLSFQLTCSIGNKENELLFVCLIDKDDEFLIALLMQFQRDK